MATEAPARGQERPDRFRYNPEHIRQGLDGEYSLAQINERIHTVDGRQGLAEELHHSVPQSREEFADVRSLEKRLEYLSTALHQKERAFTMMQKENTKMKQALNKVEKKGFFDKPWVKAIIIGLLAWWAWGLFRDPHKVWAAMHGKAGAATVGVENVITKAPAVANPGVGEALQQVPGAGGGAPAPGFEPQLTPPSAQPPPVEPPPAAG